MSASLERLVEVLHQLSSELSPTTVQGIVAKLNASKSVPGKDELIAIGVTPQARTHLGAVANALQGLQGVTPGALALALASSSHTASVLRLDEGIEIAWTGPATSAAPVRRVDQVLYELIERAAREVLLVSYVAYRAEYALDLLRRATERGVDVRLVIELAAESGGKLPFDTLENIKASVPGARVFFWPSDKRPTDAQGKRGILHAKCLVVDRLAALVSSANLTDQGLEANMELGVLLRGLTVPSHLAEHFDQLMIRGELKEVA